MISAHDFGEAVRAARLARRLTQGDLADLAGVSRPAIVRLERGAGTIATLTVATEFAPVHITHFPTGSSYGSRIKALRLGKGLTASAVSARAGVARNTVHAVEAGTGAVASLAVLIAALSPQASVRPVPPRPDRRAFFPLSAHQRTETFRTPSYAFTPLFDYRPDWFLGSGFDPSAGDGRMIAELIRRGNTAQHFVGDIREEEREPLSRLPNVTVTIGDYLESDPPNADFLITNPPFSRAVEFVEKARTHIAGPICIMQSVAWQSTDKRSAWLSRSGLAYVLNLPQRPKWEIDGGRLPPKNIWDYAWFVFLPDHQGPATMDWIRA